jgi:hypothetical protein
MTKGTKSDIVLVCPDHHACLLQATGFKAREGKLLVRWRDNLGGFSSPACRQHRSITHYGNGIYGNGMKMAMLQVAMLTVIMHQHLLNVYGMSGSNRSIRPCGTTCHICLPGKRSVALD